MSYPSVRMVRIEAEQMAQRRAVRLARRKAAGAWLLAHLAAVMQVAGVAVFVSGVSLLVGAIAGVVFGVATAMILLGALAFTWGVLREGGRL